MAAAVLSFLGAVSAAATLIGDIAVAASISDDDAPGWFAGYAGADAFVALARLAVLAVGGVLLLRRREVGRTLVLIGCGLAILTAIAGVVVVVAASVHNDVRTVGSGIGTVLGLVFPIVTAVLVLSRPTTRWLKSA